jgi:hypothetical protein
VVSSCLVLRVVLSAPPMPHLIAVILLQPEHPPGAPLRAAPLCASIQWTSAAGRGRAPGFVQPEDRGAEEFPVYGRSCRTGVQRVTPVVMFLLVPQVKLQKRPDLAGAAERWSAPLPALIDLALQRVRSVNC